MSESMRILHIILSGLYTDGWGYQENLLTKLHKKTGHEVSILTSVFQYDENRQIIKSNAGIYKDNNGCEVSRLEILYNKSILYKFKRYDMIRNSLTMNNPDILFIHGCQFVDIKVIVDYLQRHPEVTVYVDNHADFSNSASNWLSKNILHKIIWRHYAKMIEPYTKKFYGVLPARVDFLVDVYKLPKEKVELLVMGADDELVEKAKMPDVRRNLRKKHGITPDDFLIMTGGKIDLAKRQTLLLMQAVQSIPSERVKLIVFGSVVDELKEEIARLSDGAKVQYIGWIDAHDTYNHFAMADLVVFPCLHSVFWEQVVGLGLPALFNRIDGFDHVDLGGNCIFIDGNDENDIREKIYYLVNNSQVLQEMKNVAEEKGMNSFSYARIAKHSLS
jgi:glycosyltransferase involved in cell wall biosynthesis